MPTLESFMGLDVLPVSPTPADGGKAISDDLRSLVSWSPKSSWNQPTTPSMTDDSSEGSDYFPGSMWSTDTDPVQFFLCTDGMPHHAVWVPILVSNQTITLTGNVTGSGTTSIATTIGNGHRDRGHRDQRNMAWEQDRLGLWRHESRCFQRGQRCAVDRQ